MAGKCKIVVGTAWGDDNSYNVSKRGWSDAHKRALAVAARGRLALVDMKCGASIADRMPLYQCSRDGCVIETNPNSDAVLAGSAKTTIKAKKRKKRAKNKQARKRPY